MTPRTRTSNKDANYKVYYSKKIPQQARFPYREKTVRRPNPIEQDGVDKRQMKFLPEKMRQQPALEQNESEEVETEEEPVVQEAITPKNAKSTPVNERKGKKRKSSNVQEDSDSGNKPAISSSKRRRRTAALRDQPSRTLRRQSTMTQLADGRRPSLDNDEPEFRPAKRRSRASRGAERETDRRQRTLTQMIPGMGWLSKEELEELSDLDADLDHVQTYKDADSLPLVEQGLPGVRQTTASTESTQRSGEAKQNQDSLPLATHLQSSLALHSVEISAEEKEDDDEDDYQPTQFIEAPTLRTRQTPRRLAAQEPSSNASGPEKSERSRFRLLSTPEKRRVLEIPSSQSPAESVLSTQISPQKTQRSTLRERNNVVVVAETPSKRRQVTFRQPTVQPAPPVHLSKFDSTIQDSEDEGSELEDDLSTQQPSGGSQLNWSGQAIGADTQSLLLQIDRACAVDDESLNVVDRNTSDEPNESITRPAPYQPSPELGESWAPVIYDDDGPQYESYRSSRASGKLQSLRAIDPSPVLYQLDNASQMNLTTQAPMLADDIPSTPPMIQPPPGEDLSSTPMVLRDESSDEENSDSEPTPPRTIERHILEPPSTLIHQSTDLDGEPVQALRFPSTEHETQQSHSSKAEQQLQNEWLSYSQYVHTGAPNSSSMHVTANASSLNATPRNLNPGHFTASSSRIQHSQATTVDELTPKKNRTQRLFSTNTTPHRTGKAEPFVSPEKPPSLFIPSSFPSPSRAPLEGWSSPVLARTQNMYGSSQVLESLEDFSIPLPPPIADD